jgi:DNA-binding transcriptional ArsR family regulator
MAWYERPAELRERLARLIERFYEEHYREELPNRQPALEASVAAHRGVNREEAIAVVQRVTRRPNICLDDVCPGPYDRLIFTPSLDMGPYTSCADFDDPAMHGLVYPCEPEFIGRSAEEAEETTRMARIYKALGDEQRLRILQMLHEREMYAQEIVDRMDLHQSVVSRHLSFLKAVGLIDFRKQNKMKYYSLNPSIAPQLSATIDLFTTSTKGGTA